MSYARVTMIDDLPELQDLERGAYSPQGGGGESEYGPPGRVEQRMEPVNVQKHIRDPQRISMDAGMGSNNIDMGGYGMNNYAKPAMQMPMQAPLYQPNCIDFANHVQSCPICSKFYNNNKAIYIIIIVLLSIVCLLLLKKVLNV
jgi:hypothetical protein